MGRGGDNDEVGVVSPSPGSALEPADARRPQQPRDIRACDCLPDHSE
jgi:hypothetical protein